MKGKNFIIKGTIYPFDIMVSIGEADEELYKKLKQNGIDCNDEAWKYPNITIKGRCVSFSGNQTLIRLKRKPVSAVDKGVLAHEIMHAVIFIMWKVGMKLEIEVSDEAFCYLNGYITEQIYNHIT